MGEPEIRSERADAPAGRALLVAYIADATTRIGEWDETRTPPAGAEAMAPPGGAFLVAYLAGEPVGCAGLVRLDEDTGEVKRMYVAPAARRRGLARALLTRLEEAALAAGYARVRLDTSAGQPEARTLYEAVGLSPHRGLQRQSVRGPLVREGSRMRPGYHARRLGDFARGLRLGRELAGHERWSRDRFQVVAGRVAARPRRLRGRPFALLPRALRGAAARRRAAGLPADAGQGDADGALGRRRHRPETAPRGRRGSPRRARARRLPRRALPRHGHRRHHGAPRRVRLRPSGMERVPGRVLALERLVRHAGRACPGCASPRSAPPARCI